MLPFNYNTPTNAWNIHCNKLRYVAQINAASNNILPNLKALFHNLWCILSIYAAGFCFSLILGTPGITCNVPRMVWFKNSFSINSNNKNSYLKVFDNFMGILAQRSWVDHLSTSFHIQQLIEGFKDIDARLMKCADNCSSGIHCVPYSPCIMPWSWFIHENDWRIGNNPHCYCQSLPLFCWQTRDSCKPNYSVLDIIELN